MTPEQLRASILQMAIQGKLVEQRSEEGTADELLDKIYAIKKQLIKDKTIKKQKIQEPVKEDDIPFDIPASWKWVKWGDVVNIVSARRVHQSDWKKEGIPFYRAREIAEMARANGVVDNELYISEELYEEFSASGVPKAGDIMVTAVGTLGKTYIVKESDKFYYKDASVICFENRYGMCPEYLSMMMQTPLMLQQIKSNSEGTTVATLTMVRMVEYLFPLPPVDEQRRIVAKIDELLPYVDRYAEAYEKLEQFNAKFPEDMKKSILQYAIQGKLVEQRPEEGTAEELYQQIQEDKKNRLGGKKEAKLSSESFKDDEIPYEIPDTWKWVRFGHIMINRDAERIPLSVSERQKLQKTYDYYGASGVIDKVDRYLFDETLLLIGEDGANLLSRSTPIAFLAEGKYWVNNHAHVLDCNKELLDIEFIMYYINAISLAPYVTGTAQPKMNQEKMNSIPIALPPYEEQKRIVKKIKELLPYCERLVK